MEGGFNLGIFEMASRRTKTSSPRRNADLDSIQTTLVSIEGQHPGSANTYWIWEKLQKILDQLYVVAPVTMEFICSLMD
jgi:hypothetical protein